MGKLEKEINYLVSDYQGLIEFLDETCEKVGVILKSCDYYEHPQDVNFYGRVEVSDSGEIIVTLKRKLKKHKGVVVREEASLDVKNMCGTKELLEMIGLGFTHAKSKKRVSYLYKELQVDVDTWYEKGSEEEIETRIEIEGVNEDDILACTELVQPYVE